MLSRSSAGMRSFSRASASALSQDLPFLLAGRQPGERHHQWLCTLCLAGPPSRRLRNQHRTGHHRTRLQHQRLSATVFQRRWPTLQRLQRTDFQGVGSSRLRLHCTLSQGEHRSKQVRLHYTFGPGCFACLHNGALLPSKRVVGAVQ